MNTTLRNTTFASVPRTAVTLQDHFWQERARVNRETTLPMEYEQCRNTSRLDNGRVQCLHDDRADEAHQNNLSVRTDISVGRGAWQLP